MPTAVVQTQSFTDPAGHGARLLAFDQHDPARGPLAGIRLEISAEVTGKLWVESHEGRAVALTYAPQATVTVFAPAGTRLEELSVAGEDTLALAAFDGTTDFAGPSGTLLVVTASVDGVAGTEPGGTIDTAPFIGTGTVALPVSDHATNRIAGPANLRVRAEATVAGTIRLSYEETPAPATEETGGGVIIPPAPTPGPRPITVTTAPQSFRFTPRPTGWQEALAVTRFDPALGTLSAVHIRLLSTVQASKATAPPPAPPASPSTPPPSSHWTASR